MEHSYLKWKRKLEAKLTQCSNNINQQHSFLNKVFWSIGLEIWAYKRWDFHSAYFMSPHFALYALNRSFSGRTSRICVKTVQAQSILGAFFFCVACIPWFLDVFQCFFCESLTRNVAHSSRSSSLGPGFSYLFQDVRCSYFQSTFDGGISQNGGCYLLIVCILILSGSGFRKRSNVPRGTRMCFFLWSRCLWSWRINRRLWGFTVTVGSCCSHRRGRSRCNISPHKFVTKNIPVEGVNSGNLEICFDVPRRSCEMQRRVDSARNGIYCYRMARMVS